MKNPELSIIIPVYNVEQYLEECLQSVIVQTEQNLQIVLIDDGSTDTSGQICDRYAEKDSRICVIHQQNQGLSGARNRGIEEAKGKYICFVDSDDFIEKHLAEYVISNMNKTGCDVFVFSADTFNESKGRESFGSHFEWKEKHIHNEEERYTLLTQDVLKYKIGWEAWNRVFKREIIEEHKLGFIDGKEVFAEDMLFFLCYLTHVDYIECCNEVLYHYRKREDSLMSRGRKKILLYHFNVLALYYNSYLQMQKEQFLLEKFYRLYELIMDWYGKELFSRYTRRELKKELIQLSEEPFCKEQAKKLLENQQETIELYGKKTAEYKALYYRFLWKGNFNVYMIRLKLFRLKRNNKKKKMLIVNDYACGGGVENLMEMFVNAWYNKYDITVLTSRKRKRDNGDFPKKVKRVYEFPQYCFQTVKGMRRIGRVYSDIYKKIVYFYSSCAKYDIILAMKEGRMMKAAADIKATKKLAWVHLDYRNAYWTDTIFDSMQEEKACMQKYDHVICVSEFVKESIVEKIGNPGNLLVAYNPIPVEKILEEAQKKVEAIPNKGEVTTFICIGRLHEQKGFDILLKACYELNKTNKEYQVLIIGEGPEQENLKELQEKLNLQNVHFLGKKDNPYAYLVQADWFLSSSRYEGYSLVSQEAAVLGIPILATDCSGVRELLGDNEYGIIMQSNTQSIRDTMQKVLENPKWRELYCKKILDRKETIDFNHRLQEIEKLF